MTAKSRMSKNTHHVLFPQVPANYPPQARLHKSWGQKVSKRARPQPKGLHWLPKRGSVGCKKAQWPRCYLETNIQNFLESSGASITCLYRASNATWFLPHATFTLANWLVLIIRNNLFILQFPKYFPRVWWHQLYKAPISRSGTQFTFS